MRALFASLLSLSVCCFAGCASRQTDDHGHAQEEEEAWAVTAWGERYEIFPECDPLIAGEVSKCHTHVTVLENFSPLREGTVAIVLRSQGGAEAVFEKDAPIRDGIYSIEAAPAAEGIYDLSFRITSAAGAEEVAAGRVRVGTKDDPGGLIEEPGASHSTAETIPFLKEQQWRTEFATEWTREGAVRSSVQGPGRIRPAAGGDALLSAPLDGAIAADTQLYAGLQLRRGAPVAWLSPRASSNRSLIEIENETKLARERLERLEQLLTVEAVSKAEVDIARAKLTALEAEFAAARGGSAQGRVSVSAPFEGEIAEVFVVPGQAVNAGDRIARLVKLDPLWVEVALPASATLTNELGGLYILPTGSSDGISIASDKVKLVSRAPTVDAQTGTIGVIVEVLGGPGMPPLGATVQAEIIQGGEQRGVVIPSSAIVDDAGVPVVYTQTEGEAFVRREVRIVSREASHVLVEGIGPGERLVTRGGGAIRRASLVSSGVGEGHVH